MPTRFTADILLRALDAKVDVTPDLIQLAEEYSRELHSRYSAGDIPVSSLLNVFIKSKNLSFNEFKQALENYIQRIGFNQNTRLYPMFFFLNTFSKGASFFEFYDQILDLIKTYHCTLQIVVHETTLMDFIRIFNLYAFVFYLPENQRDFFKGFDSKKYFPESVTIAAFDAGLRKQAEQQGLSCLDILHKEILSMEKKCADLNIKVNYPKYPSLKKVG